MSTPRPPHPVVKAFQQLREAHRHSLAKTAALLDTGLSPAAIGSYERGDRRMSLDRASELLGLYGYRIAVVPAGSDTGWPPTTRELLQRLAATTEQLLTHLPPDPGSNDH